MPRLCITYPLWGESIGFPSQRTSNAGSVTDWFPSQRVSSVACHDVFWHLNLMASTTTCTPTQELTSFCCQSHPLLFHWYTKKPPDPCQSCHVWYVVYEGGPAGVTTVRWRHECYHWGSPEMSMTTVKLLCYMFIIRKMKARMLPLGKSWNEHDHHSQTTLLHVHFP